MSTRTVRAVGLLVITCVFSVSAHGDDALIKRGRYLTIIGGCNDCHTAGFAASGGKIEEKDWLLGDPMGWKGPWGTTYALNLRKLISGLDRKAWLALSRASSARPPMPSYILRTMTEDDLLALFEFIKSLGDGGVTMPAALPPGVAPKTPYFLFEPQNLPH